MAGLPADSALPSPLLFRELGKLDPEIVWTHEYSPFCLAAAAWASLHGRVSLLSTDLGDSPPPYACSKKGLWLHKAVSFLFDAVIAQTKEATRRSHPSGVPMIFAPHAIDTSEYHPLDGNKVEPFRFLFTGSLDDRKGIRRLIEAGRFLTGCSSRNFEIRVLGYGPLASWLSEQPDHWLKILGFLEGEALRNEYRNADAYILPTSGDTYAVTVHEAAASGLPLIVGRNAGAVETLLEDGITGFVIETANPREIASQMDRLLKEPQRAAAMGKAARIKAESYDVKALGAKAAKFIVSLASRHSVPTETPPNTLSQNLPTAASVAAVFATMNRAETAATCVRHLGSAAICPGKLFVTDNASGDNTSDLLVLASADVELPLEVIRSAENLGNAGGIKLAVEAAFDQGFQFVWILDDDSWPETDALKQLLAKDLPPDSIRSSLVLAPDSKDVSWTYEIPTPEGKWQSIESYEEFPGISWNRIRRSWLGALIPKTAYEEAGPLRGELFLRGEDEDYPRRLERLGYSFWLTKDSVLRHPPGGPYYNLSIGNYRICLERNLTEDKLYYRIRNLLWIKSQEMGNLSAIFLAAGILYLLTMHFRPFRPALRTFRQAFFDAFSNRLGKRTTLGDP
jgi:Predicted glycosyltransferases